MKIEKETIRCEAVFNEEHTHRYLWKRIWNKDKALAAVIMLNPCMADTIVTDTTTFLVVNNLAVLERFGGVEIVNLYSKIRNSTRKKITAISSRQQQNAVKLSLHGGEQTEAIKG